MKQEDRKFPQKSMFFNEHFAEAETKEALRILILQRFTEWLDHVLVEEIQVPPEGPVALQFMEPFERRQKHGLVLGVVG